MVIPCPFRVLTTPNRPNNLYAAHTRCVQRQQLLQFAGFYHRSPTFLGSNRAGAAERQEKAESPARFAWPRGWPPDAAVPNVCILLPPPLLVAQFNRLDPKGNPKPEKKPQKKHLFQNLRSYYWA